MHILLTEEGEGVARMTVSLADDDHTFDVWVDGNHALVEYQETLSWRGETRASEPDEDIFKALMTSDEMQQFLDQNSVQGVRRATPTA